MILGVYDGIDDGTAVAAILGKCVGMEVGTKEGRNEGIVVGTDDGERLIGKKEF